MGWVVLAVATVVVSTLGFIDAWTDPRLLGSVVPDLAEDLGLGTRSPMVAGLMIPMALAVFLAAFVLWRRPDDRMSLVFSVMLVAVFAGLSPRAAGATFAARPWTQPAALTIWFTAYASIGWFLVSFPDGRVPRRWMLTAPTALIASFITYPTFGAVFIHLPEAPADPGRFGVAIALLALGIGVAIAAQVVRYRRFASPIHRQQIRWAVLPFVLFMLLGLAQFTSNVVGTYPRLNAVLMMAMIPVLLFMPVAWTWAILRYRLYEIDRVLSRTISYGLVIAFLGGVYVVAVMGVSSVLAAVTNQEAGDLAVAAAVLAVVALFHPVRTHAQRAVDRRFNRTGYEAARVVATFVRGLREEVDLDTIRRDMERSAALAVHPTHLTVWLPEQRN